MIDMNGDYGNSAVCQIAVIGPPIFIAGLTTICMTEPGLRVSVVADKPSDLIGDQVPRHDVAVLDFDQTWQDASARLSVPILAMATASDVNAVLGAVRAGASGYLPKSAPRDEITSAIRAVSFGAMVFSGLVSNHVVDCFTWSNSKPRPYGLSSRECEVLVLAGQGLRNTEIARRLGIAEKTVRNHLANLAAKLRVEGRGQLVARARQLGLEV